MNLGAIFKIFQILYAVVETVSKLLPTASLTALII